MSAAEAPDGVLRQSQSYIKVTDEDVEQVERVLKAWIKPRDLEK